MADITKCSGQDCELKETCYRYTAEDSKYMQSYFSETPIKNGECEFYWQNPKQRAKILMNLKEKYGN